MTLTFDFILKLYFRHEFFYMPSVRAEIDTAMNKRKALFVVSVHIRRSLRMDHFCPHRQNHAVLGIEHPFYFTCILLI